MKNLIELFDFLNGCEDKELLKMLDEYSLFLSKKHGFDADLEYKLGIRKIDNLKNLVEYHFRDHFKNLNKSVIEEDELLEITEVAKILKVDKLTVRSYINKGLLKNVVIGTPGKRGVVRIKRSEVDRFISK